MPKGNYSFNYSQGASRGRFTVESIERNNFFCCAHPRATLLRIRLASEEIIGFESASDQMAYFDEAIDYLNSERDRVWQGIGDSMLTITSKDIDIRKVDVYLGMTVTNNSERPISSFWVKLEILETGRKVPVIERDLFIPVSGGINPKETKEVSEMIHDVLGIQIPKSKSTSVTLLRFKDQNDDEVWNTGKKNK